MDLAIVNRSFWPQSQVLGDALLLFAEEAAKEHSVCVITQAERNLRHEMDKVGRGIGVQLRICKAYTDSSSGLLKRASEAILFMLWTFISLIRSRPNKVYVSTNPPVIVPFIVAIYCRLYGAHYYYHLQDIHPEATNIVVSLHKWILAPLMWMDNFTLRHAAGLITLSDDMRDFLISRSQTSQPIHLLDNPSFYMEAITGIERIGDIVYCGNAGRLQRIPLLIAAIREYLQRGGQLKFTFVGGGVYVPEIKKLAKTDDRVEYLGFMPAAEASEVVSTHRWALLPIDDEVTRYAFPSKSSSYVLSGCGILAVCGKQTSVARWVIQHEVGLVCEPEHEALIERFFALEKIDSANYYAKDELCGKLEIGYFVKRLNEIVFAD